MLLVSAFPGVFEIRGHKLIHSSVDAYSRMHTQDLESG